MSTHETVGEKLARLSAAVRERGLNAGALGVAVALWSFADSRIGEAFPSLSDLCGRALVSERCAQTHLRDLESNGLVWVIRRDMTPVNGGVADPPLAALVQRDREGSPCAVPHGRNLYLVRPLASQAAVDAWTADGRALGRKRTVAPASTVKAPHTAPPRIVAPEKLALTPETRERGHSLFARLCEAAGRAATLAASPSLEAECAAMLVRLDANEREVRYTGALIARDDQRAKWMKKPGPVTLASLATFRGKEDASHNWRSLCALLSTARHEIFQADRRREAEERNARGGRQRMKLARVYMFPTAPRRGRKAPQRVMMGPRTLSTVPGFLAAASVARELRPDIPRVALAAAGRTVAPSNMTAVDVATIVARALDSLGVRSTWP